MSTLSNQSRKTFTTPGGVHPPENKSQSNSTAIDCQRYSALVLPWQVMLTP